jgi:hypothetical protein
MVSILGLFRFLHFTMQVFKTFYFSRGGKKRVLRFRASPISLIADLSIAFGTGSSTRFEPLQMAPCA